MQSGLSSGFPISCRGRRRLTLSAHMVPRKGKGTKCLTAKKQQPKKPQIYRSCTCASSFQRLRYSPSVAAAALELIAGDAKAARRGGEGRHAFPLFITVCGCFLFCAALSYFHWDGGGAGEGRGVIEALRSSVFICLHFLTQPVVTLQMQLRRVAAARAATVHG